MSDRGEYLDDPRFRLTLWDYTLLYLKKPWNWLRDRYYAAQAFWQRGHRGWADQDTWNFDIYTARVIGEMIAYSRQNKQGLPAGYLEEEFGDDLDVRFAKWQRQMEDLARAFTAYADFMEDYEECQTDYGNKRYNVLIKNMRPLFDYFAYLSN